MSGANWSDLRTRLISALVMVVIGLAAILSGHGAFGLLLGVAGIIGAWELWRIARIKQQAGGLGPSDVRALALYAVLFVLGLWGLWTVSAQFGRGLLLYLVGLVAVTDTLGYFTGRAVGGPKFWPAISPKKTWSGVLGGWFGSAVLALVSHGALFDEGPALMPFVLIAVALSFASQLGDIAQSAIKRRMGVKDSSNIIPGHGGVLDRFDGLLAVGALAAVLGLFG
ncbi:phosphatidate cytidylyltransferase [Tropicibacter oceani]|uniref:Phosphatidate cytidylyltransferase n=1 Tax=Tropicibacter oceani TaxID=3058420 RepID=A0ABY8QG70_9RHOB|nr:phosphatidate cytidylyltransferase [Tropicibacter oceani]WGW02802.1 phosphatidate cytidylyltransferase [Tropicibacter oceani]